jgi:hypothetical protein
MLVVVAWVSMACALSAVGFYGYPYYRLELAERANSPLHPMLRPSGYLGIRLGVAGVLLFGVLFLYAVRKRVAWLGRIGQTRRWLDFHVLAGVSAPILITFHSTLKFQGLAGLAYWIMVAVAASGIIGRYLYAKTAQVANVSSKELDGELAEITQLLAGQTLLTPALLQPLLRLPSREEVARMSLAAALGRAIYLDLARPFQVSSLRRHFAGGAGSFTTLGGFLPTSHSELERVIASIRLQSWLSAKILFLNRMHDLFHFWHVVHRPFSYSFAVLVVAHITVALLFGYY